VIDFAVVWSARVGGGWGSLDLDRLVWRVAAAAAGGARRVEFDASGDAWRVCVRSAAGRGEGRALDVCDAFELAIVLWRPTAAP
jgi:hypothetical protein